MAPRGPACFCAEQTRSLCWKGAPAVCLPGRKCRISCPDRLEAGTHNIPGIAGLLEGIRYVRREGPLKILERERRLMQTAVKGLSALPEITVYADPQGSAQAGVLSFQVGEMDCELVGEALGKCGIAVRAGLHCSPLAHRSAGTYEKGTVPGQFFQFQFPPGGRAPCVGDRTSEQKK